MEFETRNDVTVPEYMEMIRLKTSVLLSAALKIGAVLGGASEDDARKLYDFGIKMGLAFQLQDDYLDVYGDSKVFGKNIGGDILCNKKDFYADQCVGFGRWDTTEGVGKMDSFYCFLSGRKDKSCNSSL